MIHAISGQLAVLLGLMLVFIPMAGDGEGGEPGTSDFQVLAGVAVLGARLIIGWAA